MVSKKAFVIYFRNFIFGVEDSLASTVGLLSGVAITDVGRRELVSTGFILIFVEAFSMAVGSFLSEQYAEDYVKQGEVPMHNAFVGSIIMFFSYLIAGLIPITPYILAGKHALAVSIIASLIGLFLVGLGSAKVSGTRIFSSTVRMVLIGGLAVLVGVIVGHVVSF